MSVPTEHPVRSRMGICLWKSFLVFWFLLGVNSSFLFSSCFLHLSVTFFIYGFSFSSPFTFFRSLAGVLFIFCPSFFIFFAFSLIISNQIFFFYFLSSAPSTPSKWVSPSFSSIPPFSTVTP